jgi:hypothetical protein
VIEDSLCAEPRRYRAYWGGLPHDWQQFRLPNGIEAGKYLVTAEYFTNDGRPMPVVVASVRQGRNLQDGLPISVARTSGNSCSATRTVDLGTFEITGDSGDITLTAHAESEMSVYGLTLIRLPVRDIAETSGSADHEAGFAFRDFDISASHYAFTVDSPKSGLVLVNEIFYPGWTATIDGKSAKILRGDAIFRALHLEGGTHRIEMKFAPPRLFWGALISLATLAGLAFFLLRTRKEIED